MLHFFIILFKSLKVSLLCSHFSSVIFLKILTFFKDEDLFSFILLFVDFHFFIDFFLKNLIFCK